MSKKTFKRIFFGLIAVYFVMLAARTGYDLVNFQDLDIAENGNIYYSGEKEGGSSAIRNYASQKMEVMEGAQGVFDQKYERIANITSKTVDYDEDFKTFNSLMEDYNAVIQMENRRGLEGGRRADFVIGVRPENFDEMEAEISKIGRITSSTTTKTDKTYEYSQMLAEKEILEQRIQSYEKLKENGGSISEMLQLEDKIIEVQTLIQEQMIGLGEYSDENALCTINFTLYEGSEATLSRKLWNSFTWTSATYFMILFGLLFIALIALTVAFAWNYLKKVLVDKPKEKEAEKEEQDENKEKEHKE